MQTAFPVTAASIALLCACASASAQKPKPKPQPKSPTLGAIGTSQMPGSICKFNTAYTLGKKGEAQINVSITGAEYVVTRVRTDTLFRFPPLNKKQLVVRFTLHNPLPVEQRYGRWITFTAVPVSGDNSENSEAWMEAVPNQRAEVTIKPAQKIACYTIIEVPADGETDKLILQNTSSPGSPVARFPLARLVKKIAPPYVDPEVPSGFTPLKTIKAKLGDTLQIEDEDVAALKVEQIEATGDPLEIPNEGYTYVLITFQGTCRNEIGGSTQGFEGGWMSNELIDADGGAWSGPNQALRASSVDFYSPKSNFGEPTTFRRAYVVKRGIKLGYIKLGGGTAREVRWDLEGFMTK